MFHPKRLVFCGGGTRCIIFVEALVELEKAGLLRDVTEYWGTSAGAFVAVVMAIAKSPSKMKPIIETTNFTNFRDMDITNLLNIAATWGLDNGKSLSTEIGRVLEELVAGSSAYTLSEVPSLSIVVSDLNLRQTLVLNGKTHPTIRIVDAVRASMGLPMFYCPYKDPISGNLWIDGALRANFAWNLLPSDADRRESLGFCITKSMKQGPESLVEYMFSMVHFDEPAKHAAWKRDWPHNILWFPAPPFPAWYMKLLPEDFALLWSSGRDVAASWLSTSVNITPTPVGETAESQSPSYPPNIPSQTHPASQVESSGIPLSCPSVPGRSVVPPAPGGRQTFRRWSL
jgi:predicted acylesterase/phospholipase RssA